MISFHVNLVFVQALLTKAEESDSGEDKLFIQNLRNKPKKTEGKKKRRKESGSSVTVAARGTGGGSLQDLAAAPPARARAGTRGATSAKHSQACDEDGGGVAGRTREGILTPPPFLSTSNFILQSSSFLSQLQSKVDHLICVNKSVLS